MADRSRHEQSGAKGLSPQEAEARAIEEKTARLRALRLARDAADQSSGRSVAAPRAVARKKTRKPGDQAASLAEWLATQQKEGRRS
jgi:hypothetical protein